MRRASPPVGDGGDDAATITPRLLLYARAMRIAPGTLATSRMYATAGGYVATWALFSAGATAPQRWFASLFAAEKSSSWRAFESCRPYHVFNKSLILKHL